MYSLVMFYYAFKEDLKPIKPLGKFLSIKMIIFATFWQAVVVSILVEANAIPVRAAEPASMFGTLPRRRGASLHFFFFVFGYRFEERLEVEHVHARVGRRWASGRRHVGARTPSTATCEYDKSPYMTLPRMPGLFDLH